MGDEPAATQEDGITDRLPNVGWASVRVWKWGKWEGPTLVSSESSERLARGRAFEGGVWWLEVRGSVRAVGHW